MLNRIIIAFIVLTQSINCFASNYYIVGRYNQPRGSYPSWAILIGFLISFIAVAVGIYLKTRPTDVERNILRSEKIKKEKRRLKRLRKKNSRFK